MTHRTKLLARLALPGLLLLTGTSFAAWAPAPGIIPPSKVLAFDLERGGSPLGTAAIRFRHDGADLHVDVAIDLAVEVIGIDVYRYTHRNHEVWRDGKLVAIDTQTDDNGTKHEVKGRAIAEGFRVDNGKAVVIADADIMPTSYWNPDVVNRKRLLNAEDGKLVDVSIAADGEETLKLENADLTARRYRMTGDLKLTLWYAPTCQLAGLAFMARGSEVTYRLEPGSLPAAAPAGAAACPPPA